MPMQDFSAVLALIHAVTARFPDEARLASERLASKGYDPDAWHFWFEEFAQITTEAIRRRDETQTRAHLMFMSDQLHIAGPEVFEAIDVSYTENLMWDLGAAQKKWGWTLVPENLRALYRAMWGEP